jgi:hypothetical protein
VSLSGLVLAFQSVAITYGGWQRAPYFAEEDRDRNRNLPHPMILLNDKELEEGVRFDHVCVGSIVSADREAAGRSA